MPGKTRLINYFLVDDAWYIVDLPGYGYAKVPAEVQKRWRPMVETYLTSRSNMRGMVLLLDIRREPSKEDLNLWHWLQTMSIEVVKVITKADKLSRNKRNKQIAAIAKTLGCKKEELIEFSAMTGEGRHEIWKELLRLLETKH